MQHENDLNERSKFHFDSDLINEVVGFTRMAQQIVIEALIQTNNDKMAAVSWLLEHQENVKERQIETAKSAKTIANPVKCPLRIPFDRYSVHFGLTVVRIYQSSK